MGRRDSVDSEARPIGSGSHRSLIPDLRNIPLDQLATLAAEGEGVVVGVVSRIVAGQENPSLVEAMMFNSTI
jgi:hypothetical protein